MTPRRANPAFTIVEAALSTIVIGVMLVAALNTVGASRASQARNADRSRAVELAGSLMAEITAQAYEDGLLPTGNFGLPLAKVTGDRSRFNDVDDYDAWTETPPRTKSGGVIPGFDAWTRSVRVRWVNPANPDVTSLVDTGAKRITVTVARNGVPLTTLDAVRTSAR
ncbi:MAG: type II secretion system protein [Phycisphaerales bacterium]|nr:type II secretion system protein [Phycisphaerales bacterium]